MEEITQIITPCRCGKCIYCELGGNPPAVIIKKEASCDSCHSKDEQIRRLRTTLEWYLERIENCNRWSTVGDIARDELAKDSGERAKAALSLVKEI